MLAQRGFDATQFADRSFVRPPPKAVPWPAPRRTGRTLGSASDALETIHVGLLVAGAFLPELAPGLPKKHSVLDVAWNAYDALKRPRTEEEVDSAQPEIDALVAQFSRVRKTVIMGSSPGDPERALLYTKTKLVPTRAFVSELAPKVFDGVRKVAASGHFPAVTQSIVDGVERALEAAREAVTAAEQAEASNAAGRAVNADPQQRATDVLLDQYDLIRMAASLHLDEYPIVSEILSAPVEKKRAAKKSDEGEDEGEEEGENEPSNNGGGSVGNGEKGDAKKDGPEEKKKK